MRMREMMQMLHMKSDHPRKRPTSPAELATYVIPMLNKKEMPIFFDVGILSLHKTGIGRMAIEMSKMRMMI